MHTPNRRTVTLSAAAVAMIAAAIAVAKATHVSVRIKDDQLGLNVTVSQHSTVDNVIASGRLGESVSQVSEPDFDAYLDGESA